MKLYLNEAHSMYENGHFFTTYRGLEHSLEKTPLLYWPLLCIWAIFGAHLLEVYIYTFIIGWINLFLTWWLAKQLYPNNFRIAWWCVLIMAGNLIWPAFCRDLRFEGLLTLFGLLFLNIAVKTLLSNKWLNWIGAGICFGLCIFAKGAVGLIFYLPLACALPFISVNCLENLNLRRWYLQMILCMSLGLLIPIAWLILMYVQYGASVIHYLLYSQITNRVGFNIIRFQSLHFIENLLPWSAAFLLVIGRKIRHNFIKKTNIILLTIVVIQLMFFDLFVKMHAPRYFIPVIPTIALILASLIDLGWLKLKSNVRSRSVIDKDLCRD